MESLNFDVLFRIFNFLLSNERDLNHWAKTCGSLKNFFQEESVCKRILDEHYGLDQASKKFGSYRQLMALATQTTNVVQAFQYGFFKKITTFRKLSLQHQIFCVQIAAVNNNTRCFKYAIDSGFNPENQMYNDTLFTLALSCKSYDIISLFLDFDLFKNSIHWTYTPDFIFDKYYSQMKQINNCRFLLAQELKPRWDNLLKKLNYNKASLVDCDAKRSKLTNEAVERFMKFMPNDITLHRVHLTTFLGKDFPTDWIKLFEKVWPQSTDEPSWEKLKHFYEHFTSSISKEAKIYLLQRSDFKFDFYLLNLIFINYHGDCYSDEKIQTLLVQKYNPNTSRKPSEWNPLLIITKRNYLNDILKYWVKHETCLLNFLSHPSAGIIENALLKQLLPTILETLKTNDHLFTFLKYLGCFKQGSNCDFEICRLVFAKYHTIAIEDEVVFTLFKIGTKNLNLAKQLFKSFDTLPIENYLTKIDIRNYKAKFQLFIDIKDIPISTLKEYCHSHTEKSYASLFILSTLGVGEQKLKNVQSNNHILNTWKENSTIGINFLLKQDESLVDYFLNLLSTSELAHS
jgi:hypothetical protein